MKKCEICKEENLLLYNIPLPRNTKRWVKNANGVKITQVYDGIKIRETDICPKCFNALAGSLPICYVEE